MTAEGYVLVFFAILIAFGLGAAWGYWRGLRDAAFAMGALVFRAFRGEERERVIQALDHARKEYASER